MAEVVVRLGDDFGIGLEKSQKETLDNFLTKFGDEIPGLKDIFYEEDVDDLVPFGDLRDHSFSTRDRDELSLTLINLLSSISNSSESQLQFSLGGNALPKEFFKELYLICDDGSGFSLSFAVYAEVVGYPGYYDARYELVEDGWNISSCTFYEEDSEEDW